MEENKDPATLRCVADSNPPSTILWRKEGLDGIFSPDPEIDFSPVTKHTSGLYSCTAENALGMSKQAFVELDVKCKYYQRGREGPPKEVSSVMEEIRICASVFPLPIGSFSDGKMSTFRGSEIPLMHQSLFYPLFITDAPSILNVGPSPTIEAVKGKSVTLTCEAEGNPEPNYQWLQKLPSQEVLIRGYEKHLFIRNVSYEHQGDFVCKAMNSINGETRSVQSEPIGVNVSGAPQVMKYSTNHEVRVQNGADAALEVFFCADPVPKAAWDLGDAAGVGNSIVLATGTGHGRFVVESKKSERDNCYVSTLKINGAHPSDSHGYQVRLSNSHGSDTHIIHLMVRGKHTHTNEMLSVAV